MEHPVLLSAATAFKAIPEKLFSALEQPGSKGLSPRKHVYVFQKEYATVDPALVDVCMFFIQTLINIVA